MKHIIKRIVFLIDMLKESKDNMIEISIHFLFLFFSDFPQRTKSSVASAYFSA